MKIFLPQIALTFLLSVLRVTVTTDVADDGDRKLTADEIPTFIKQEVEHERNKRAIPVAAISGIVSMLSKTVGGKLKAGLSSKMGSSITTDLVKGLVSKVMSKILDVDHMEDIHKEVSAYLDKWQEKSDKKAGEITKNLKSVIDSLVKKNADLLKSKAKINIIPQKGMQLNGVFSPPGYKIETSYATAKSEPDSSSNSAYVYDKGIGNVIINGCYKPSYSAHDPCHASKRLLPLCDKMLEGATFIGVGFDGRGAYSSSSRRKSIVQRICLRGGSYDRHSVPDSMTVHGIYDTDVMTMSFSSMSRYQEYLEKKAAVAKSGYMFMDAVAKAYGKGSAGVFGLGGAGGGFSTHAEIHASGQTSSSQSLHSISQQDSFKQMYMSLLQVDVARYEIFMDDVKPHDLNMDFLHDFTFLPTSYFSAGAPLKYQNFLLRYGTHYIKSAKFGGSLRLFKVKRASKTETIDQFSSKAQSDYKAMFSTYMAAAAQFKSRSLFHKAEGGAEGSTSSGGGSAGSSEKETQSSKKAAEQQKYSNEVLTVEGGDQTIAAVISEMYTVGFKHELVDWLQSIPKYPKPIDFQMAPISDLCNINFRHLFPAGVVDFGCFGEETLLTENGTDRKYYVWKTQETNNDNTTYVKTERRYCDFVNQQGLENAMKRRCRSLRRAIEVYLEEGPVPVSDMHLPPGRAGCETSQLAFDDIRHDLRTPSWDKLTDGRQFKVIFDMREAIRGVTARSSALKVFFRPSNKRWYVKSADEITHLYDGWGNGGSGIVSNKKISLRGLVMTYNPATGLLQLTPADYRESKKVLPDLSANLTDKYLARVEYLHILNEIQQHKNEFGIGTVPCNVVWSNAHRFNPAVAGGRCISFAAISAGDIFVVFAAIPRDRDTWYYVQISPHGVAIYKGLRIMKFIDDSSARGLGDHTLFQLYFVCIKEEIGSSQTTILYGKTMDTMERGHVYGAFHDTGENLHVRFYAFGNGAREVEIMDAHVLKTSATGEHVCVGDTIQFEGKCIEDCHPQCIGCHRPDSPKACNKCRNYKLDDTCVGACPDTHMVGLDGITCTCKVIEDGQCVANCSDDRVAVKSGNVSLCTCRFHYPDTPHSCLAGCPLTTYSSLMTKGQTQCILCHAVCKPQDEGVPVCTGPTHTGCTECYKVANNQSCVVCGVGKYIHFLNSRPVCRPCSPGYRCPGDGRRYQCSLQRNERSSLHRICLACPQGSFSTIPPSQSCHRCRAGFYKKTARGRCIQCPGKTAGLNCQVRCKCVYGRCIKVDGSCSCWRFFKGHRCQKPTEGALRLVDDRILNKFINVVKLPSRVRNPPLAQQKIRKISDAVARKVSLRMSPKVNIQPKINVQPKVNIEQKVNIQPKISKDTKSVVRTKRAFKTLNVLTAYRKKIRPNFENELTQIAVDSDVLKPVLKEKLDFSGKIRGRLEVYHNGQWGTVCGRYWTELNTKTACRQFFYKAGIAKKNAFYGRGRGPIWITKINCRGNEKRLLSCPRPRFWGLNVYRNRKVIPCRHSDDIGLICY